MITYFKFYYYAELSFVLQGQFKDIMLYTHVSMYNEKINFI